MTLRMKSSNDYCALDRWKFENCQMPTQCVVAVIVVVAAFVSTLNCLNSVYSHSLFH